jgi:hypothetical protein
MCEPIIMDENKEEKSLNSKNMSIFPVRIEEIYNQNDVLNSLGRSPSNTKEQEMNSKIIMQRTFIKYFNAHNKDKAYELAEKWCNENGNRYFVFGIKR